MYNKALKIATQAHEGQFRKKTGLPYIVHPIEVSTILMTRGYLNERILAAALLHDVIEDSPSFEDHVMNLDHTVHHWVTLLTNKPTFDETCEQLAKAPWEVQIVKCADIMSNTRDNKGSYVAKKLLQLVNFGWRIQNDPFYKETMEQLKSHV